MKFFLVGTGGSILLIFDTKSHILLILKTECHILTNLELIKATGLQIFEAEDIEHFTNFQSQRQYFTNFGANRSGIFQVLGAEGDIFILEARSGILSFFLKPKRKIKYIFRSDCWLLNLWQVSLLPVSSYNTEWSLNKASSRANKNIMRFSPQDITSWLRFF